MSKFSKASLRHPVIARMKVAGVTSLRDLARRCGTHHPVLSRWVNGRCGLSKAVGLSIARVLHVSVETVLYDWSIDERPGHK